jgi:hypothetical protein
VPTRIVDARGVVPAAGRPHGGEERKQNAHAAAATSVSQRQNLMPIAI